MGIIVHITDRKEWQKASESGWYTADTLRTQGFIHCSTSEQVIRVANFLFKAQRNLVLLYIDTTTVNTEIKYENLEGGTEFFPHVYGALAASSVVKVLDFLPKDDGTFELPGPLPALPSEMMTEQADLVLNPTSRNGTTAFVAEQ